jgi:hypothetical protein
MSDPAPNPDPEPFHRFHNTACKAGILGGEELVGDAQLSSDFFDLLIFYLILCRIRIQIRIRLHIRIRSAFLCCEGFL